VTASLTVVVPAFNERENLAPTLTELADALRARGGAFELVVVDDGSTDGSAALLDELAARLPELRVVAHRHNRGLTAALRSGFAAARMELVTWSPADGQIPSSEIVRLADAWGGRDLVLTTYANRRPDGFARAVISRGLRTIVAATIGFRDRLDGVYLVKREVLASLDRVSSRSAGSIAFEIGAKVRARGLSVGTIAIACAPRRAGESKVAGRRLARNILATLEDLRDIRRSMRKSR
jgi:glycosyltransferase involved in cell wall biosynthesis